MARLTFDINMLQKSVIPFWKWQSKDRLDGWSPQVCPSQRWSICPLFIILLKLKLTWKINTRMTFFVIFADMQIVNKNICLNVPYSKSLFQNYGTPRSSTVTFSGRMLKLSWQQWNCSTSSTNKGNLWWMHSTSSNNTARTAHHHQQLQETVQLQRCYLL